jgi:hypothetical protein
LSYKINLTGKRFGKLTVIEYAGNKKHNSYWKCKCDCGNETDVMLNNLTRGMTKSCGCLRKQTTKERRFIHGMSDTSIHNTWMQMIERCENPNNHAYKNYGGRGIYVCIEWHEFENFYNWAISNGYKEGLTIDRIDVDGNYKPNNCRWVDYQTQQRNRRNNRLITYKGKTHCLAEWEDITGIKAGVIAARLDKLNWSVGKALTQPVR